MKILESLRPTLAELGKIKIGGKGEERTSAKGTKYRVPEKHSYFTITGNDRDSAGDLKIDDTLMKRLVEKYGVEVTEEKKGAKTTAMRLREIPIALLSDEIDEILLAAYCYYDGRHMVARCDGETCTWYRNREGKAVPAGIVAPCNGEHEKMLDSQGRPIFKLHTKFLCTIADGEARWGGVYALRSTSKISLEQLFGTLQHIKALTGGILAGLPLRLVVRGIEVAPEGKASTVYVVHVELRGGDLNEVQRMALQMAQVRLRNARELSAVGQQYRALLSAPGENEDPEEQADVAQEFAPAATAAQAQATQAAPAVEVVSKEKTPEGRKVTLVDMEDAEVVPPATPAAPAVSKVEAAKARGRKAAGKEPVTPTSSSAAPVAPPVGPKAPPPVAPESLVGANDGGDLSDDLADIPF